MVSVETYTNTDFDFHNFPIISMKWAKGKWEKPNEKTYSYLRWLFSNVVIELYCNHDPSMKELYSKIDELDIPLPDSNMTPDLYVIDGRRIDVYEFKVSLTSIKAHRRDAYLAEAARKYGKRGARVQLIYIEADEHFPIKNKNLTFDEKSMFEVMRNDLLEYAANHRVIHTELENWSDRVMPPQKLQAADIADLWMKNKTPLSTDLTSPDVYRSDAQDYVYHFFETIDKTEAFMDKNLLQVKDFMSFWKHHTTKLDKPFYLNTKEEQRAIKDKHGRFYNAKHPWTRINGYNRANYLILPPFHKSLISNIDMKEVIDACISAPVRNRDLKKILTGLVITLLNPQVLDQLREINKDIAYTKATDLSEDAKWSLCVKYDVPKNEALSANDKLSLTVIRKYIVGKSRSIRHPLNERMPDFKYSAQGNLQIRDRPTNDSIFDMFGMGKRDNDKREISLTRRVYSQTKNKYGATQVDLHTIQGMTLPNFTSCFKTRDIVQNDIFDNIEQYPLYGINDGLNGPATETFRYGFNLMNEIRRTPMAWFLNVYSQFYRAYTVEMCGSTTKNSKMTDLRYFKHPSLPVWFLAGVPPNTQTTGPIMAISFHDSSISEEWYLPALEESVLPSGNVIRISKPFRLALDFLTHAESYEWSYYGTEGYLREFRSSMVNTSMEYLWLPSSRNITEFLDIIYLVYKNVKSYGTFGLSDALKKLAIKNTNDVRVVFWLHELETKWAEFNLSALEYDAPSSETDPAFGILAEELAVIHNIAYLKQIQPKLDGLDQRKILSDFFTNEIGYQGMWETSPFNPEHVKPNENLAASDFYMKLWDVHGDWAQISWSPNASYHLLEEIFTQQLKVKPSLVGQGFPVLSSLEGVKTTKVLVADTDDKARPGTEKGSYEGLYSVNLNEANYYASAAYKLDLEENQQKYKLLFEKSLPYAEQFGLGDTDPTLQELGIRQMHVYPPMSCLVMKLKAQSGYDKRAFFVQTESMRNLNKVTDEGFKPLLRGNPNDAILVPGTQKLIMLTRIMNRKNYSPTNRKFIITEDQTKYGDLYPMEAIQMEVKAAYFCGNGPAIKFPDGTWLGFVNNKPIFSATRYVVSLTKHSDHTVSIMFKNMYFNINTQELQMNLTNECKFVLGMKATDHWIENPINKSKMRIQTEGGSKLVFNLDEQGYLGFFESELALAIDRALADRIILMPHETAQAYNKLRKMKEKGTVDTQDKYTSAIDNFIRSFGPFIESSFGHIAITDPILDKITLNPFIIKKVGFTLGVLNTRGTLLSVCHTRFAEKVMSYAGLTDCFFGVTHSDDSIKYTDFVTMDINDLGKPNQLPYLASKFKQGYKLVASDGFKRFRLSNGEDEEFVSPTTVFKLMMAASLISPRLVGQRPSLMKYSFGYTGEVLQTIHEGGSVFEPSLRFVTPLVNALPNESYSRDLHTAISRTRPILESFPSSRFVGACYIMLSYNMAERFGIPYSQVKPNIPTEWGGLYFALPGLFFTQGINANEIRLLYVREIDQRLGNILDWSTNIPEIWEMKDREIDELVANVLDVKGHRVVMDSSDDKSDNPILEYRKQFLIRFAEKAKTNLALQKLLKRFWVKLDTEFGQRYPKYRELQQYEDQKTKMRAAFYFFQEDYLLRRNTFNLKFLRFIYKYTTRSYMETYIKVPIGAKIAARIGYWGRLIPNQILPMYRKDNRREITIGDMWTQIYKLSQFSAPSAVLKCQKLIHQVMQPMMTLMKRVQLYDWEYDEQSMGEKPLTTYRQLDQWIGPVTFSKDVPMLIGLMLANADEDVNTPVEIIRGGYKVRSHVDEEELSRFDTLLRSTGFHNKEFLIKHHRFLIKMLSTKVYRSIARTDGKIPLIFSLTTGYTLLYNYRLKYSGALDAEDREELHLDTPSIYDVQARLMFLASFHGMHIDDSFRITHGQSTESLISLDNVITRTQLSPIKENLDRMLVNFSARNPSGLSFGIDHHTGIRRYWVRLDKSVLSIDLILTGTKLADGVASRVGITNETSPSILNLLMEMLNYYLIPSGSRLANLGDLDDTPGDFNWYDGSMHFKKQGVQKKGQRRLLFVPIIKTRNEGEWQNGVYKIMNRRTYHNLGIDTTRAEYIVCPYRVPIEAKGSMLTSPEFPDIVISDQEVVPMVPEAASYIDGSGTTIEFTEYWVDVINKIIDKLRSQFVYVPVSYLKFPLTPIDFATLRKIELYTFTTIGYLLTRGHTFVNINLKDGSQKRMLRLEGEILDAITSVDSEYLVEPIVVATCSWLGTPSKVQEYLKWIKSVSDINLDDIGSRGLTTDRKDLQWKYTVSGGVPNGYLRGIQHRSSTLLGVLRELGDDLMGTHNNPSIPLWGHGLIDQTMYKNLYRTQDEALKLALDTMVQV